MSMKLNAGDVVRQDEFLIDPQEILVDDALNGRWQPHDDEAVENMVKSFSEEGQLQAVQVRRIHDNKVQLVLGYRRYNAARLYNERHADSPMKLKCKVVIVNDEEAFRRNIAENRERAECSPVDDAHNQRRLREGFGWTDAKIAEFYHVSAPYVGVLKKLLTLPSDVQKLVHERRLSVQAATGLADLPAEEQKQILAANLTEGLTSQNVVKHVRDKKIDKGKGQSRSLAEVRAFLEGLSGPAEATPLKEFVEDLLKFFQGKIKDETMEKRLRKLLAQAHEPQNAPVSVPEPETTSTPPEPVQIAPEPIQGIQVQNAEHPVAQVA
jgi:ParB family transcriptional regulator, chromosome partitioning protein